MANELSGEGNVFEGEGADLPAGARTVVVACCDKVVPKVGHVAGDQHLPDWVCDLSLAERETFNSERKVSRYRVAVAAVESCHQDTVRALAHNGLQSLIGLGESGALYLGNIC